MITKLQCRTLHETGAVRASGPAAPVRQARTSWMRAGLYGVGNDMQTENIYLREAYLLEREVLALRVGDWGGSGTKHV